MQIEYPTYEHREAALDCLLQLCRLPSFWSDLYLNYDCHLYCPDVCAALIAVLSQHAFAEDHRLLTTHITALDALLALTREVDRARDPDAPGVLGLPPPGSLADVRDRKRLRLEGSLVCLCCLAPPCV